MRRIVAAFGAIFAAVAMSIGGASVASADDITVQNAAIGLWPAPFFVGQSVPQVIPGGGVANCQALTLLNPGSIANTGGGTVTFYAQPLCAGGAVLTLGPNADDANTVGLNLVSGSST